MNKTKCAAEKTEYGQKHQKQKINSEKFARLIKTLTALIRLTIKLKRYQIIFKIFK